MAENGNKFDILKLVLAIIIVGIHSTRAGMILRPVFRLAVPLFFIISSYLFFLKQCTLSSWRERYKGLKKYAKRILLLYLFWFLLLFPFTIYYREWYVDFCPDKLITIARSFFFGSTFVASWFLMASLVGVTIVWLLSSLKVKNSVILAIGIVIYMLCCLVSNYYNLLSHCPSFVKAYTCYTDIFTQPFNSFPCSILFVGIGKILAEKELSPSNKLLWIVLFFSMVLLYVEFYITQHYFKAYYDDCFLLLPVACACIFMLIGQSSPRKTGYDTIKLRTYSTIIYCCHGTLLSIMNSVLNFIKMNEINCIIQFAMFFITIFLSIAICELLMRLERRRYFGWLRYSH
ncbi:MAG: acyltransferase [Muribaculaceae bacterium]|nr:acyltransferase [Muribaculaceae bacterium]